MIDHIGIGFGDRVAIMLEPSLEFYVSLFGTLKRGAIAVPFFPLFGPEAVEYRLKDSGSKMFVTTEERGRSLDHLVPHLVKTAPSFIKQLEEENDEYESETSAEDVAVFQYTSGSTRTGFWGKIRSSDL
jgi:acetyl-CoA synthetase